MNRSSRFSPRVDSFNRGSRPVVPPATNPIPISRTQPHNSSRAPSAENNLSDLIRTSRHSVCITFCFPLSFRPLLSLSSSSERIFRFRRPFPAQWDGRAGCLHPSQENKGNDCPSRSASIEEEQRRFDTWSQWFVVASLPFLRLLFPLVYHRFSFSFPLPSS